MYVKLLELKSSVEDKVNKVIFIILSRDYNKQDNQQQDAFQIPVGLKRPIHIFQYINISNM